MLVHDDCLCKRLNKYSVARTSKTATQVFSRLKGRLSDAAHGSTPQLFAMPPRAVSFRVAIVFAVLSFGRPLSAQRKCHGINPILLSDNK